MSKQTILVCMNEVARVEQMLTAITVLNRKQEAHFIGIYVIPTAQVISGAGVMYSAQVVDTFRVFFKRHAEEIKNKFEVAIKTSGISGEWREIDSESALVSNSVITHARMCDMVIVPQSRGSEKTYLADEFTEQVVMDCGRPVLVMPNAGELVDFGNSVMVAWDASKEATRAVFNSISMLESAERVFISWHKERFMELEPDLPGAEIAAVLSRRGINVTIDNMPESKLPIGDALLAHARELGADMLVMGAYGHSRLRETIFGGATRSILENMPVPVLMSN